MDITKSPLKSLTLGGGGLALVASVAKLALSAVGVTDATEQGFYIDNGLTIAAGVGALLAIVGRLRATKVLKF